MPPEGENYVLKVNDASEKLATMLESLAKVSDEEYRTFAKAMMVPSESSTLSSSDSSTPSTFNIMVRLRDFVKTTEESPEQRQRILSKSKHRKPLLELKKRNKRSTDFIESIVEESNVVQEGSNDTENINLEESFEILQAIDVENKERKMEKSDAKRSESEDESEGTFDEIEKCQKDWEEEEEKKKQKFEEEEEEQRIAIDEKWQKERAKNEIFWEEEKARITAILDEGQKRMSFEIRLESTEEKVENPLEDEMKSDENFEIEEFGNIMQKLKEFRVKNTTESSEETFEDITGYKEDKNDFIKIEDKLYLSQLTENDVDDYEDYEKKYSSKDENIFVKERVKTYNKRDIEKNYFTKSSIRTFCKERLKKINRFEEENKIYRLKMEEINKIYLKTKYFRENIKIYSDRKQIQNDNFEKNFSKVSKPNYFKNLKVLHGDKKEVEFIDKNEGLNFEITMFSAENEERMFRNKDTTLSEEEFYEMCIYKIFSTISTNLINIETFPFSIINICRNQRIKKRTLESCPGKSFRMVLLYENDNKMIKSNTRARTMHFKMAYSKKLTNGKRSS